MRHILVLLAAAAVMPDLNQLKQMSARFAPVTLKYDAAALSSGDRKALPKLLEAARVLNLLFLDQMWSGNRELYAKLQKDTTPLGQARLHYFWLNKGPWSDLDDHAAFVPGVPARKPQGANFYPPDMTREEFEAWVKTLPAPAREQALGFFTVVRRDAHKQLILVPYNKEYAADLGKAAGLLREAAPLDIAIGPYEPYSDELFGYKAGFEGYITIRDEAETNKLKTVAAHLQEVENQLPLDRKSTRLNSSHLGISYA